MAVMRLLPTLAAGLAAGSVAALAQAPYLPHSTGQYTEKGRALIDGGRLTVEGQRLLGVEPDDMSSEARRYANVVRVCPPGQTLEGMPCDAISLSGAITDLADDTRIVLASGTYRECAVIRRNNVMIEGLGVVLSGRACAGKGALVVDGRGVTVKNIACEGIAVPSRNGACVRYQGTDLTLQSVLFSGSETGLLAGSGSGGLAILRSTFFRNGKEGLAHQVYFNRPGDALIVGDSKFLAAQDEGHGIKTGARETILDKVVIDGTGGQMSRNIDAYNGGILRITDSVLVKAPSDANTNIIGYDYEARTEHAENLIVIENTRIDCGRRARILAGRNSYDDVQVISRDNTITGNCLDGDRFR